MSDRRRRTSQSPSPGVGPSSLEHDVRQVAEVVPKSGGGFEVEPSNLILKVSKEAYKSRMSGCWPRWDDIPSYVMNAIWADLMAAVRVDPQDIDVFRNHWNQKMRTNYRQTLSRANKSGKKPSWMGDDIWAGLQQHWESEAFKELSAKNAANRNKNPALHRGGSKSFQQHRRELYAKYHREPTVAEVFRVTHAVEQTDDEGNVSYDWSDPKAKSVMERYEAEHARATEASGREQLTLGESNRIWDSIIDPPTRNRRYGFGNMALNFQTQYRRSVEEEEIARLQRQLDEFNDWRKSNLMTQIDERIAAFYQEHGSMPGEGGANDGDDNDDDDDADA